ncbi:TPA: formylmethanofuran--tetrahydromethanopterin N-formyltransferase, partial [Candidatus Bathyarchaeota archaeon]|nr:formylmethanofuran--tetrahydromethanopterin N-formyltransferase [Candidatus Bathyarchaeota archaeon]
EAGVEGPGVPEDRTPDGRPGVHAQFWHLTRLGIKAQLMPRIGQCILTCPTTRLFDGLPGAKRRLRIGPAIRLFGDGFEEKAEIGGRKGWRIPVMEGEFFIENYFGAKLGVANGNFVIMGRTGDAALRAALKAVEAVGKVEGVILPFPSGICRLGLKARSRRYKLPASINHPLYPTLREAIPDETRVPEGVGGAYQIVVNGLSLDAVNRAIAQGIKAAARVSGVVRITASNFGGRLGRHRVYLSDVLP